MRRQAHARRTDTCVPCLNPDLHQEPPSESVAGQRRHGKINKATGRSVPWLVCAMYRARARRLDRYISRRWARGSIRYVVGITTSHGRGYARGCCAFSTDGRCSARGGANRRSSGCIPARHREAALARQRRAKPRDGRDTGRRTLTAFLSFRVRRCADPCGPRAIIRECTEVSPVQKPVLSSRLYRASHDCTGSIS